MKLYIKIITLLIVLVCILTTNIGTMSVNAGQTEQRPISIFDIAEYFDTDTLLVLNQLLWEAEDVTGFRITVMLTDQRFVSIRKSGEYTEHFYNEIVGQDVTGIILLINSHGIKGEMHDYIYANGNYTADIFTSKRIDNIFDDMWDRNPDENYEFAIYSYISSVKRFAEAGPVRVEPSTMLFVMLIADIIIVIAILAGVRTSYKISRVKCAANYLDRDSVNYRQRSDTYIRTYVTKVKIQKSSSSGGGGRSSGGGRSR